MAAARKRIGPKSFEPGDVCRIKMSTVNKESRAWMNTDRRRFEKVEITLRHFMYIEDRWLLEEKFDFENHPFCPEGLFIGSDQLIFVRKGGIYTPWLREEETLAEPPDRGRFKWLF